MGSNNSQWPWMPEKADFRSLIAIARVYGVEVKLIDWIFHKMLRDRILRKIRSK